MRCQAAGTQVTLEMNLSARRQRKLACTHQCTKCGLIYHCGEARCGRPFYSGVCARTATFANQAKTLFALS